MMNIANTECINLWSGISGATIHDTHICPFEEYKSACNVSQLYYLHLIYITQMMKMRTYCTVTHIDEGQRKYLL
jgi:hypothetical protein